MTPPMTDEQLVEMADLDGCGSVELSAEQMQSIVATIAHLRSRLAAAERERDEARETAETRAIVLRAVGGDYADYEATIAALVKERDHANESLLAALTDDLVPKRELTAARAAAGQDRDLAASMIASLTTERDEAHAKLKAAERRASDMAGSIATGVLNDLISEKIATLTAQRDQAVAELAIAGPLLAVVALMDDGESPSAVKVHRDSMSSIAPLFGHDDERALYLREAAARFIDGAAHRGAR